MFVAAMNSQIEVLYNSASAKNSTGGRDNDWKALLSINALIISKTDEVSAVGPELGFLTTKTFQVDYSTFNASYAPIRGRPLRIVYDTLTYNVTAIRDIGEMHKTVQLDATQVP